MKTIVISVLIISALFLSSCSKSQYPAEHTRQQNLTPRGVLKLVKRRYHGHHRLEVKAAGNVHIKIDMRGRTRHQTLHTSLYFAMDKQGKLRFEGKNSKLGSSAITISNGGEVWQYIPLMKEYTEKKNTVSAAGINHLEKRFKSLKIKNSIAGNFAKAFNPLADSIKSITSLGRDTLVMPDSTSREVRKIRVSYIHGKMNLNRKLKKLMKNPSVSIKNFKLSPITFWVDTAVPVVLRQSFRETMDVIPEVAKSSMKSIKISTRYDLFYPTVNLNPTFQDTTFTFQPPRGVKKVEKFDFAKKIKQAEKN